MKHITLEKEKLLEYIEDAFEAGWSGSRDYKEIFMEQITNEIEKIEEKEAKNPYKKLIQSEFSFVQDCLDHFYPGAFGD